MEQDVSYEKKLCMSELLVRHSVRAGTQFREPDADKANSSFIFLVKGAADICAAGRRLAVRAGELFYIPDGLPYTLQWTDARAEYYALHAVAKRYESALVTNRTALQKIPQLSTPETLALFRRIFGLMATGGRVEKIRAVGLYYAFYADALPLLAAEEPVPYNPAVPKAMALIEENYRLQMPIGEIAAACFVSESRLYHLFQAQLGTTPAAYRNEVRVRKAAELLRSDGSIEEIAEQAGFRSAAHLREIFKARTGMTPAEYRREIYNRT